MFWPQRCASWARNPKGPQITPFWHQSGRHPTVLHIRGGILRRIPARFSPDRSHPLNLDFFGVIFSSKNAPKLPKVRFPGFVFGVCPIGAMYSPQKSDFRDLYSGFAPSGPCFHPKSPLSGICSRGLPHRGQNFDFFFLFFVRKCPKNAPQGPRGPGAIFSAIFRLFLGPRGALGAPPGGRWGCPGAPLFSLSWAAALWGAPPVQFTLVCKDWRSLKGSSGALSCWMLPPEVPPPEVLPPEVPPPEVPPPEVLPLLGCKGDL